LDAAGLVVAPGGDVAIAMVSGDGGTGRSSYSPQVRYARGRVAAEAVQGVLFDEYAETSATMRLWFLLHEITHAGWRAELSLPTGVGRSGWITGWRDRIEIVDDRRRNAAEPESGSNRDLPAPRVRWRESA
jgi:hypothetical protein